MSGGIPRISDRSEWLRRANEASATLQSLSGNEFYNPITDRYNPVREEIHTLVWSLGFAIGAFRDFLDRYPQTAGWLPAAAEDLAAMSCLEIQFRIIENMAGERWVDGALFEAFGSGVLKAALDRLIADFDQMVLATD